VRNRATLMAMNLAVRKPMSLAEFFDWEERQELRYEFDGVLPVAMTGGTAGHATIQRNLVMAVGGRLRGKSCQFYGSDLKIQVADDHIRYPDGMVVCSATARTAKVVHDPVVIFEVLSSSTAATDRIVKAREYQATPSVKRYVMLEQDRTGAPVNKAASGPQFHEIKLDGFRMAAASIAAPFACSRETGSTGATNIRARSPPSQASKRASVISTANSVGSTHSARRASPAPRRRATANAASISSTTPSTLCISTGVISLICRSSNARPCSKA
jgi:Uma2 family endonuclease